MENKKYVVLYVDTYIASFDTWEETIEYVKECKKEGSIYLKKDKIDIYIKL